MPSESNSLTPWQKDVNAKWFKNLSTYLGEGGVWMWPDTGLVYTLQNGKFVGENEEANRALQEILPEGDPHLTL